MNLTEEIITSIMHAFCVKVLLENDIEMDFYHSAFEDEAEFINHYYADNKQVVIDMLNDYFTDGEAEDDLICGNAEYWNEEFSIPAIADFVKGDEYDIAKERLEKIFSV